MWFFFFEQKQIMIKLIFEKNFSRSYEGHNHFLNKII